MSDLSYQQKAVFDRIEINNERVLASTNSFRLRATAVTTSSAILVGLITSAKYLPDSNNNAGVEFILLALACLMSIGIVVLASLIWRHGEFQTPGGSDVDKLYDSYISKEEDTAYANLLIDACHAFEANRTENKMQGKRFDRIIYVFIFQLFVLATSVGWSSICALLPFVKICSI